MDLAELGRRATLPVSKVNNALKALELDGGIALSDGAHSPSRVLMRAGADTVHDLRVKDNRAGPLLEALLRLYGGLFEEAAIIDEEALAKHLGKSVMHVRNLLFDLSRTNVLKVTGVKGGVALLTGGLALDSGLLAAIQEEMVNEKVNVQARSHADSIYAGAIGAALWGAYRHARLNQLETAAA